MKRFKLAIIISIHSNYKGLALSWNIKNDYYLICDTSLANRAGVMLHISPPILCIQGHVALQLKISNQLIKHIE